MRHLSNTEIEKLTIAPTVAKTTVLIKSSEFKFGIILKKVPPAVPTNVGLIWLLISINR